MGFWGVKTAKKQGQSQKIAPRVKKWGPNGQKRHKNVFFWSKIAKKVEKSDKK